MCASLRIPFQGRGPSRCSGLERATAAAALLRVGIDEGEAPLVDALVEIERGAVEEEVALLVDNHRHAVLVGLRVGLRIKLRVEAERVTEAAAAAAGDTHAEHGLRGELLLRDDLLDLAGGLIKGTSDIIAPTAK